MLDGLAVVEEGVIDITTPELKPKGGRVDLK